MSKVGWFDLRSMLFVDAPFRQSVVNVKLACLLMLQQSNINIELFHELPIALGAFPCSSPLLFCASCLKTPHDQSIIHRLLAIVVILLAILPSAEHPDALRFLTLKRSDAIALFRHRRFSSASSMAGDEWLHGNPLMSLMFAVG